MAVPMVKERNNRAHRSLRKKDFFVAPRITFPLLEEGCLKRRARLTVEV